MRSVLFSTALAASFLFGAGVAQAEVDKPSVEVSSPNAARFADAGESSREIETNVNVLTHHLQNLGKRWLAPGQHLSIEIVELDLAGRVFPSARHQPLRVLNGGADWPRIEIRYVLSSPAGEIGRGQDRLSDMTYMVSSYAPATGEPLGYERRMLTEWFRKRFGATAGH
jgi:hypothetical protein